MRDNNNNNNNNNNKYKMMNRMINNKIRMDLSLSVTLLIMNRKRTNLMVLDRMHSVDLMTSFNKIISLNEWMMIRTRKMKVDMNISLIVEWMIVMISKSMIRSLKICGIMKTVHNWIMIISIIMNSSISKEDLIIMSNNSKLILSSLMIENQRNRMLINNSKSNYRMNRHNNNRHNRYNRMNIMISNRIEVIR